MADSNVFNKVENASTCSSPVVVPGIGSEIWSPELIMMSIEVGLVGYNTRMAIQLPPQGNSVLP